MNAVAARIEEVKQQRFTQSRYTPSARV